MGEFRNRTTGKVLTQGEVRAANKNMSLPKVWDSNVCDSLNVDPVLPSPMPVEGIAADKMASRNGVEKNSDGDWVEAWSIIYRFTSDSDGTKADKDTAYQAELDAQAALGNRKNRDAMLAETDWWASSDLTMTSAQTTYRQALRDITSHSNWPNLADSDWPTKP